MRCCFWGGHPRKKSVTAVDDGTVRAWAEHDDVSLASPLDRLGVNLHDGVPAMGQTRLLRDWLAKARVAEEEQSAWLGHAAGTRELLTAWAQSEAVCSAGAFHAAYVRLAEPTLHTRAALRGVIGMHAEMLVFLLATAATDSLDAAVAGGPLVHQSGKEERAVTRDLAAELLIIRLAALAEAGALDTAEAAETYAWSEPVPKQRPPGPRNSLAVVHPNAPPPRPWLHVATRWAAALDAADVGDSVPVPPVFNLGRWLIASDVERRCIDEYVAVRDAARVLAPPRGDEDAGPCVELLNRARELCLTIPHLCEPYIVRASLIALLIEAGVLESRPGVTPRSPSISSVSWTTESCDGEPLDDTGSPVSTPKQSPASERRTPAAPSADEDERMPYETIDSSEDGLVEFQSDEVTLWHGTRSLTGEMAYVIGRAKRLLAVLPACWDKTTDYATLAAHVHDMGSRWLLATTHAATPSG